MKTLEDLRTQIDIIDQQLAGLIEQRVVIAKQIQQLKKSTGLPTEDKSREREIIQNLCALYPNISKKSIQIIYQTLFDSSKE
jgi:chorismate mutase